MLDMMCRADESKKDVTPEHAAVACRLQQTRCNLLPTCGKCPGRLGYTSTCQEELLTETWALHPENYTQVPTIDNLPVQKIYC